MNKRQFGNAVTPTQAQTDERREVSNDHTVVQHAESRAADRPHASKRILNWEIKYGLNPTAKSTMNLRNACRLARAC